MGEFLVTSFSSLLVKKKENLRIFFLLFSYVLSFTFLPIVYEVCFEAYVEVSLFLQTELNQVRHMVVDVSCLDKNVDLRLMLSTKRVLTALTVSFLSIFAVVISVILHYFTKKWSFSSSNLPISIFS
jgi:hypothetical protein